MLIFKNRGGLLCKCISQSSWIHTDTESIKATYRVRLDSGGRLIAERWSFCFSFGLLCFLVMKES